jgi:hypothetical protein
MINYCPECGVKIEKNYKFCANCGTSLKGEPRAEVRPSYSGPVVMCNNCGEENPADAYECSSCGITLKKEKPRVDQDRREPKKKAAVTRPTEHKSLEITKLIPIFAGLAGLVLVILLISGVFDSSPENPAEIPSSGVNLGAVQQINDLEKRVQADPGNNELLLELAHLKYDNGFYERAIEDYRKYLESNPSDPDARIDMGVCYYNLRQYDTAMQEMKKALEYKPDHQIGHLNLGIVNLAAGNIEESRSWLEKAAAINPDNQIGLRAKELLHNH